MSEVSLHPLNRLTTLTNRDDQALVVVGSGEGSTADATETRSALGLGNVDNTADADKPVSTATQAALDSVSKHLIYDPPTGGDEYAAFASGAYDQSNKIKLVVFRIGADHTSGGIAYAIRSVDGAAWSDPYEIHDPGGTLDVRDLQASWSPETGRFYVTFAVTDSDSSDRNSYISYSTDGGQTWSTPVQLPADGNTSAFVSGPMTELGNSICVIPAYRGTYGANTPEIGIWRSTTGPSGTYTWVQVAANSSTEQYNECSVVKTASGKLILLARSNLTYRNYSSFMSEDNGATWTRWVDYPKVFISSAVGVSFHGTRPDAIAIGETIVIASRLSSPGGWGYFASPDYGATWHELHDIRQKETFLYGRFIRVEGEIQHTWAREDSSSEGSIYLAPFNLVATPVVNAEPVELGDAVGAMLTSPAAGLVLAITDDSASGLSYTPTNVTGCVATLGNGRAAYQFNGSGTDSIVFGTTSTYQAYAYDQDFVVGAWVRIDSSTTDQNFVLLRNNSGSSSNNGFYFAVDNVSPESATLKTIWKGVGSKQVDGVCPLDEWFWLGFQRKGTAVFAWVNNRRFYLGATGTMTNGVSSETPRCLYSGTVSDALRFIGHVLVPGSHTYGQVLSIQSATR